MVDLNKEIKARGRKPAFGPMSATRNRRLLSKAIEDEDTEITEAFQVLYKHLCVFLMSSSFFFGTCARAKRHIRAFFFCRPDIAPSADKYPSRPGPAWAAVVRFHQRWLVRGWMPCARRLACSETKGGRKKPPGGGRRLSQVRRET